MAESSDEMRSIGGYFELAEYEAEGGYPVNGVRLNTSRNALEYIFKCLPDIKHVFLPYYTCSAVIQPLNRLPGIGFSFYHINNRFELAEEIVLKEGEYLIANNFFGIKDSYIVQLANKYGSQLIVDNAQALFAPALPGTKAFYSARKYVGVADGGFAFGVNGDGILAYDFEDTSEHDSHLFIRRKDGAEAGFRDYQKNECKLDYQPIRKMSIQTQDILLHINYQQVVTKRRANYEYLHEALGYRNQLVLPASDTFACPMVYPFLDIANDDLRNRLIDNRVYVAKYWPNVLDWAEPGSLENVLTTHLIPLPIDQRYGELEMDRIISLV